MLRPELQQTELSLDFTREEPSEVPSGKEKLERLLLHSYLNDLASDSWRVRKKGAKGLGERGEIAWVAIPELEKLLDDPDLQVQEATRNVLSRLGGKSPCDVF